LGVYQNADNHQKNFGISQKRDTDLRTSTDVQNAVNITQKLGIEYLWIDSLCIIQQDFGDWKEGPKMDQIYSNAYLSIAAT
jgi:Heterokaryon incompatibility protein (HET)